MQNHNRMLVTCPLRKQAEPDGATQCIGQGIHRQCVLSTRHKWQSLESICLQRAGETYCVEASSFPSGLNARAIVERGRGGTLLQYADEQCRSSSSSNQCSNSCSGLLVGPDFGGALSPNRLLCLSSSSAFMEAWSTLSFSLICIGLPESGT